MSDTEVIASKRPERLARWITLAALLALGCASEVSARPPTADASTDALDPADRPDEDSGEVHDAPTRGPDDGGADGSPGPSGSACDAAERVAHDARITGATTEGATVTTRGCLPEFRGPLRLYRVEVPPDRLLAVSATPASGSGARLAIRVFDGCAGACLSAGEGAARWLNASLSPRVVVVAIGGLTEAPVTFDAAFAVRPVVAGELCAASIDVATGPTIRVDASSPELPTPLCDRTVARARWFRVSVPANHTLSVLAPADVHLRAAEGCDATACLANETGVLTLAHAASTRVVTVAATRDSDAPYPLDFQVQPAPAPRSCAAAPTIRVSSIFPAETLSTEGSLAPDCQGGARRALFYRVAVPAGTRVTASTSNIDTHLRLIPACESSTCAASSSYPSPPTVRYVNGTASAQEVVLVAGPRSASAPVTPFPLAITFDRPSPATSCETAPEALAGSSVGANLGDATSSGARCAGGTASSLFWATSVPPGRRLLVTAHAGTVASLLPACGASTCLGAQWSDNGVVPGISTAWTNEGATAARVIVALSSSTSLGGGVGATVDLMTPAPEGRCATAPRLMSGARQVGLSVRGSDEALSACVGAAPPALWWRVDVPAGQRIVASATSNGPDGYRESLGLTLRSDCAAVSCLSSTILSRLYAPATLATAWSNPSDQTRTVYLVAHGTAVLFDLSVVVSPPPPDASCASATALTIGQPVTNQRFADAVEPAPRCGSVPGVAPARYYRVTVPPGRRLDARATGSGGTPLLRILDACGGVSCLARDQRGVLARWINRETTSREVIVAVSRGDDNGGVSGVYDLTATLATPPTNARCGGARTITPGDAAEGTTEDAAEDATTCDGAARAALYYQVTVPAGHRLVAQASSGSGSEALLVRALSGCDASTCLATSARRGGLLWWSNPDGSSRTVTLAVSATDVASSIPFSLSTTLEAVQRNGRCASATAVGASTTLTSQRLLDAAESNPACAATSQGALYYAVRVPAGMRLQARATPRITGSLVYLGILLRCDATVCASSGISGNTPVQWTNTSGAEATVLVAASTVGMPGPGSLVDLDFSIAAP